MFQFTLAIWMALACLVIAALKLHGEKGWWRVFPWYLLIAFCTEALGFLLHFYLEPGKSNAWVFNIFLPLEMAFFTLALSRTTRVYGIRAAWFIAAFLLVFCLWLYESIGSSFTGYSTMANLVASILIVICCCLFYYYLLRAREYVDLPQYPPFWVVSGIFIFYFGSTGLNAFTEPLRQIYISTGIPIRFIILLVLNLIMYTCWSYAFICRKRNRILSSPSSSFPQSS